ncbi:MAG: ferric reductase-like transmembrane domain-containing protein [Chloroflexota bacterium]|nr:ferric reductase-like transmembrane domain-containing protein [Chloroflexota bacterium]
METLTPVQPPRPARPATAAKPSRLERALLPTALTAIGVGLLLLLGTLASQVLGISNVYWYLSRSSALVAFTLLWASMVLGVGITNRLARLWPGAPTAFDLHQYVSLLGIGFALVHVLTLLGDTYIGYNLAQLLIPFGSTEYAPFWVGIGQVALYLLIPVTLSFYVRKRLGTRGWRTIHGLSYALYGLTLLHSIFSGSDSGAVWTTLLYSFTALSLVGLTAYRVLLARSGVASRSVSRHSAA